MADNINIVYRIDTNDILKGINQLRQIDQANDKFKSSTQSLANSSTAAYGQMANSLAGMRLRLEQVKALMENTARTNTPRLQQLSREYRLLDEQIKKVTADLYGQKKATDELGRSTTGLTSDFGNLTKAVQLFIAAAFSKEVLEISLNMAELAGRVDGVTRAFQNQIPNSTMLLEELRKKTHGTIDELQLMQYAIKAQNFKIPLNDLGNLLEFAMIRAQQTGESIDYMVNSIITGLGRDSIKILDNLQVDIGAMKKDMAELGISIDEAFGIQVQREIQKMGGYIENSATLVQQLKANFESLKQESAGVGEAISTWIVKRLNDAVEGARTLVAITKEGQNKPQNEVSGQGFQAFMARLFRVSTGAEDSDWKIVEKQMQDERKALDQMTKFQQNFVNDRKKTAAENAAVNLEIIESEKKKNEALQAEANKEAKYIEDRIQALTAWMKVPGGLPSPDSMMEWYDLRDDEKAGLKSLEEFNAEVEKVAERLKMSRGDARQWLLDNIEEQKKAVDYYKQQNNMLGIYIGLLNEASSAQKKAAEDSVLKDEGPGRGLIGRLEDQIKQLGEDLEAAQTEKAITKINDKLKELNKELTRLRELRSYPSDSIAGSLTQIGMDPFKTDLKLEDLDKMKVNFGFIAQIQVKLKSLRAQLESAQAYEDISRLNVEIEKLEKQLKNLQSIPPPKTSWSSVLGDPETQQEIANNGITIMQDQLNSIAWMEVQSYEYRLANLHDFYDRQLIMAGDNQKKKDELRMQEEKKDSEMRKKIAQKEKEARRFSVLIDTAAGIMRAFATAPNIYVAIVQAALVALQGVSQLAIINRAQPRGFAKGGINIQDSRGVQGKDSIPAVIMPGESVITTEATARSPKLLKKIQAKEVDDRILDRLEVTREGVRYVGMGYDDSKLRDEIRRSRIQLSREGGILYEHIQETETYRKKVRAKSI